MLQPGFLIEWYIWKNHVLSKLPHSQVSRLACISHRYRQYAKSRQTQLQAEIIANGSLRHLKRHCQPFANQYLNQQVDKYLANVPRMSTQFEMFRFLKKFKIGRIKLTFVQCCFAYRLKSKALKRFGKIVISNEVYHSPWISNGKKASWKPIDTEDSLHSGNHEFLYLCSFFAGNESIDVPNFMFSRQARSRCQRHKFYGKLLQ